MKITYKEMSDDLNAVIEARKKDPLEKYEIEIEGEMKTPTAMVALDIIDGASDFEKRAQFVKTLLAGCRVTIYKEGKKSFSVAVNQGMEWWSVNEFNEDPMALRSLVVCVYTKFLKKYIA